MRTLLSLSLLVLLSIPACGGASGAAGKWTLDTAPLVAEMQKEIDKMSEADKKAGGAMATAMLEMMKKMKAEMTLNADGSFAVSADNPGGTTSKIAGTWKLDGNKITMTGKEEGKDVDEVKTGTLDGDTINITEASGPKPMTMVFRRN